MTRVVRPSRRYRPDYSLILFVYALVLIGIVMIFSASVVKSYQDTSNPNFYFIKHLLYVGIGTLAFIFASRVHYSFWKRLAPILFILSILLLGLVFVPSIGFNSGGATRWIKIGGIIFQPTEMLKITIIIFWAYFFDRIGRNLKTFKYGLLPFLFILGLIGGLIMKQPDLGTFMMISLISATIFFVAGANLLHLSSLFLLGIGGTWFFIKSAPYRMERFIIFLNPGADTGNKGYQINQALLAIGTGGLLGLGFGQSRQKYQYLPEAMTDSIFAIMSEELGFLKVSLIIILYVLLIYQGYRLAQTAPDRFSRLLTVGVITWVASQTFINIMAIMSLLPLTGIPLPFISYGGSSMIFLLFAFGILINISRYRMESKR